MAAREEEAGDEMNNPEIAENRQNGVAILENGHNGQNGVAILGNGHNAPNLNEDAEHVRDDDEVVVFIGPNYLIQRQHVLALNVLESQKNSIPGNIWEELRNNAVKSYKNEEIFQEMDVNVKWFGENRFFSESPFDIRADHLRLILPIFPNLRCLDIPQTYLSDEEARAFNADNGQQMIAMRNLRTLKIHLRMFALLNNRIFNFSSSTDLEVLHFNEASEAAICDINELKGFISSLTSLKELSFIARNTRICDLFSTALDISSRLDVFEIDCSSGNAFRAEQQDNFCNFIAHFNAHRSDLKRLKFKWSVDSRTRAMQELMNERLDMPLTERFIRIVSDERFNVIPPTEIDDQIYSAEFLNNLENRQDNDRVTTLKLKFVNIPERNVEFVASSYPNLQDLTILYHIDMTSMQDGCIQNLNGLAQLNSLTMSLRSFKIIEPTTIGHQLKNVRFKLHGPSSPIISEGSFWSNEEMESLRKFLENHITIKKLEIDIEKDVPYNYNWNTMNVKFVNLIVWALTNLRSLIKFHITVKLTRSDERRPKTLGVDWNYALSNQLVETIREQCHARPGFMLQVHSRTFELTANGSINEQVVHLPPE